MQDKSYLCFFVFFSNMILTEFYIYREKFKWPLIYSLYNWNNWNNFPEIVWLIALF